MPEGPPPTMQQVTARSWFVISAVLQDGAVTSGALILLMTSIWSGDTGLLYSNTIEVFRSSNVQALVVRIAERQIADPFGNSNGTQMFTLRRKDPYAAGTGAPDVTVDIALHSIR